MDGKELAVWTGTCAKGTVHIDVCASAQAFKVFWGEEKQHSPIVISMWKKIIPWPCLCPCALNFYIIYFPWNIWYQFLSCSSHCTSYIWEKRNRLNIPSPLSVLSNNGVINSLDGQTWILFDFLNESVFNFGPSNLNIFMLHVCVLVRLGHCYLRSGLISQKDWSSVGPCTLSNIFSR
jgi:hypothetical protein